MAPLSTPVRRRLARDLAAHSADRPTLGDVELSVLTRTAAATFLHPSPFELHYSADWRDAVRADRVDHASERTDEDLAAHRPVVAQALACYRSSRPVTERERKTDGHGWDVAALRTLRERARGVLG